MGFRGSENPCLSFLRDTPGKGLLLEQADIYREAGSIELCHKLSAVSRRYLNWGKILTNLPPSIWPGLILVISISGSL